jgi:hypothetical protein
MQVGTIRGFAMSIIGSFARQRAATLRSKLRTIAIAIGVAGSIAGGGAATVNAQPWNSAPSSSPAVPNSAFFMGLGGSYNSVNFASQNIYAQGVSVVTLGGTVVAFGQAGGPADPYSSTQSTFAPVGQVGYLQHFAGSKWLWGAKFSYSLLDATSTNQSVIIPQVGSFVSSTPDTFTGNVVVRSYQTSINQQMTLTPFIGRSFDKSLVYLGIGPSLSQTHSNLNGVIGFADINGVHTNITGTASNFSSSPWVYGAVAVIGATYFLDQSWFLDFGYAYGMTKVQTNDFAGPFSSTTSGYVDSGILSGNYSGRVITQSATISINKAF